MLCSVGLTLQTILSSSDLLFFQLLYFMYGRNRNALRDLKWQKYFLDRCFKCILKDKVNKLLY